MKSLIKKLKKPDSKTSEVVLLEDENMEENYLSLDESILDDRAPTILISKARAHKLPTLDFDKDKKQDKTKSKPMLKTLLKKPTFPNSPR